jgi:hypothetical protein
MAICLAAFWGCETTTQSASDKPDQQDMMLDDGIEGVQTRAYEEGEDDQAIGVQQKF